MKKITGYKIVYTVHDEETGVLTEHLVNSELDLKNLDHYLDSLEEEMNLEEELKNERKQ